MCRVLAGALLSLPMRVDSSCCWGRRRVTCRASVSRVFGVLYLCDARECRVIILVQVLGRWRGGRGGCCCGELGFVGLVRGFWPCVLCLRLGL